MDFFVATNVKIIIYEDFCGFKHMFLFSVIDVITKSTEHQQNVQI